MTEEQKKQQTIEWVVTGILLLLGFYNHLALIFSWPHIEVVDAEVTRVVGWFYELVVGFYAYWRNNNITSPAQAAQVILNKFKKRSFTDTGLILKLVDMVSSDEISAEQLQEFVDNDDLKEITQAHIDGKTVEVNIPEGE